MNRDEADTFMLGWGAGIEWTANFLRRRAERIRKRDDALNSELAIAAAFERVAEELAARKK